MKNLGIICAAIVLAASMVATVSAGENISKSTLSSMGLGSMQQISDNEGLAVRGKGAVAVVWGTSSVNLYGAAKSSNSYFAASSHRYGANAEGWSKSFAVVASGHHVTAAISGGSSGAWAR